MKKGFIYEVCPKCGKHGLTKSAFKSGWHIYTYMHCKYCAYEHVFD